MKLLVNSGFLEDNLEEKQTLVLKLIEENT